MFWSSVRQTLTETVQPQTVYELRVKVRNNQKFALRLFAVETGVFGPPPVLLASRQFSAADNNGDELWHEQVLRYESGTSAPSGSLRIVLLAGTIPAGGGGGTDSTEPSNPQDPRQGGEKSDIPAEERAQAGEVAVLGDGAGDAEGGPGEEDPDPYGEVRFDDVRLTKRATLPAYLFHGMQAMGELSGLAASNSRMVYNARRRVYYADVGRFGSEDPIGDAGGSYNWYPYAANNPGNWSDTSGYLLNKFAHAAGAAFAPIVDSVRNAASGAWNFISNIRGSGSSVASHLSEANLGVGLLSFGAGSVPQSSQRELFNTNIVTSITQSPQPAPVGGAPAQNPLMEYIRQQSLWLSPDELELLHWQAPQSFPPALIAMLPSSYASQAPVARSVDTPTISALSAEQAARAQRQSQYPDPLDAIRRNGPRNDAEVRALRAAAIVESNAHRSVAGQIFFNLVGGIAEVAPDIAMALGTRGQARSTLPGGQMQARMSRGRSFDAQRALVYPHNQVHVRDAKGRRSILDSYGPEAREIVSRKFTQFDHIFPPSGVRYVGEAATKYAPGSLIISGPLAGQKLQGRVYLEVPVQTGPIPQKVIDAAKRLNVKIRDTEGREYN